MALPSKVVSLWFWPQLEQASVPSSIQCMDSSLVSNNFLALLSASNRMLHALVFSKKKYVHSSCRTSRIRSVH